MLYSKSCQTNYYLISLKIIRWMNHILMGKGLLNHMLMIKSPGMDLLILHITLPARIWNETSPKLMMERTEYHGTKRWRNTTKLSNKRKILRNLQKSRKTKWKTWSIIVKSTWHLSLNNWLTSRYPSRMRCKISLCILMKWVKITWLKC